jgi:site-specific DNA-methyltransferase (adenine-specific)
MIETNTIHLGDCLELMKEISDKSIDLILTDPPYGMKFQSNYRMEKHKKIDNDNNLEWLSEYFNQINRIKKDDAHLYFFCSFHHIDKFKIEIEKHFKVKNILIWFKNNTGMGDLYNDYAPEYEMIIYCNPNNKKLNGGRNSNILKYSRTNNELHPTQKPLDLISFLISKSSNENDLVLDTFSGSGVLSIACHNLKRNFICIEKDKDYYEASVKRYNDAKRQLKLF